MTGYRTSTITTRVGEGGRIVIPASVRKALGIEPGDEIVLRVDDDSVRILSRKQALRNLQDMVAKVVPPGVSLVDEFLRERREEARAEEG